MAYFSALGGTGGTSATITVTYSEDFYGTTITATNGTTTLTKTATSSGTLVFDVSEGGTWVVSGTVEGATYSESVDVTFEYTTPPLVALPDGSTATPINDIQMWLKCAAIRDKTTYTTLSDVLADTDTFIALCADSNACDYMARSTNWASGVAADSTAMLIVGKYNYCANKLIANNTWFNELAESDYWEYVFDVCVPKMTSNTSPSGECFAKDVYSGQNIYAAFDRNPSIGCHTSTPASVVDWYIGYKFTHSVKVYGFSYRISQSNSQAISFTIKLQGTKDNGSTWTDLTEVSTLNIPAATPITGALPVTKNLDNYDWYRIYTNGKGVTPLELQFLGHTDNANYIPLVPKMTSNTTPSGTVISLNPQSSYPPYQAFDQNANTYGTVLNVVGNYIGYEFDTPQTIGALFADCNGAGGGKWKVQYKISGSWEDAENLDIPSNSSIFALLPQTTQVEGVRLVITEKFSTYTGNGFNRLQFYRKSDLPIIHSAVEDSIFYMDDGSPVALCGIPVGDTIDVDLESFKGQTLTLVSTVAKNPTNLSNDFSMNVRITPNITEIYLMPVGALYWWGHEDSDLENMTTANGWSNASGYTYGTPTHNKNSILFSTLGSGKISGVGMKASATIATLYSVTNGTAGSYLADSATKTHASPHAISTNSSGVMAKFTSTVNGTRYAWTGASDSGSATCYALWFE